MPPPRRESCDSLPGKARQQVIELGEFHLQLAFAAARMAGENIEDQLRAVDDAAVHAALQVALLHRSQIAVEDNQRGLVRVRLGANLIEFAAADDGGRVHGLAHLQHAAGDHGAGAARQFGKFFERFPRDAARVLTRHAGRALQAHAHQQHALMRFGGCRS